MDAPNITRARAKQLRRAMSLPEVLLWNRLRRRQLNGLHFRRQHPLGPYVLDFYCDEARLAVEIDGDSHNFADRARRDARRDRWLAEQDVRSLRIAAQDVLQHLDDVLATLAASAPSPPRSPASRSSDSPGGDGFA